MIYLIKSGDFLKIGFTTDIYKRYESYSIHNPDFQFLGLKEGDTTDEKYSQQCLKQYAITNTEWMCNHKNILKFWKELPNLDVTIPNSYEFGRACKNLAVNSEYNFASPLKLKLWKEFILKSFKDNNKYQYDFYELNKLFGEQFRNQNISFTIKNMKKYFPGYKKIQIIEGSHSKTYYDFSCNNSK